MPVINSFKKLQLRTREWATNTLGEKIFEDKRERVLRVLEEAIELAQADYISIDDVFGMANYVYAKPVGERSQEAAGVGFTLLGWCEANGYDLEDLIVKELDRVDSPEIREKIRLKHKSKIEVGLGVNPEYDI